MLSLILTLASMAIGPLSGDFFARGQWRAAADGFVVITVLGLIAFTLLPEAVEGAGLVGLGAAALAFALPWIAERQFHRFEKTAHKTLLILAAIAFALHAAVDGAVIRQASDAGNTAVIAGMVLHRAGAALTLWWLMTSSMRQLHSLYVLCLLGLATAFGFEAVEIAEALGHTLYAGLWQALAAGSLMHLILHPLGHVSTDEPDQTTGHRLGTTVGLVSFVGFLALASQQQDTGHSHGVPMDLLQQGLHSASSLIAITVLGVIFSLVAGWSDKERALYRGLRIGSIAALVFWFSLTLIGEDLVAYLGDYIHHKGYPPAENGYADSLANEHGHAHAADHAHTALDAVQLTLWLIFVTMLLVKDGARGFFGQLGHRH